ncbi:MAG TPA: iron-containing alcohol dehydrogenase [Candidatus Aminicenantes bacterium]|nr:iron-containing alcohol dehydrogenase [Candidatus Aminicenantes bacterium]HRY64585.1 iron-containing alcohol dehydrogenase [Candidatus Aminicenantes bacterium]HRZ71498.1 iron-containing alcohol dehydrogenase [Candidatus Aminicenantes bacterium]
MKEFLYFQPTEIRFGRGRLSEVGQAASRFGSRAVLVTVPDEPCFKGLFARTGDLLAKAGMAVARFAEVVPNPTTEVVTRGAKMAREFKADVVVAVGGGSSIDTAKAIAVEAAHRGTAWDYLYFREKQPTAKTLPVIAVTTTSGTGSHVTQVAVVTNPAEKNKSALFHPLLYPRVSLVDPELMASLPKKVTASTGFDVFAHAFESFINPGGSPYTDMMALEAIGLVAKSLPAVLKDGNDLAARERMAWADTLAGLCIANAGVTMPHGIGMAIGGIYPHVAHGQALAVVYPAILDYTLKTVPGKFAAVGRILEPRLAGEKGIKAAEGACAAIKRFIKKIGMDVRLRDFDIPEGEIEALAHQSMVLPDYKNHPRLATLSDISAILGRSY